ncbi:HNH endonuclease [Gordonia phage Pons]|uniref:HNH endonuclease n=1 Tax=Gordonia phage Pons TaxID=2885976 RepID=A0AAE9C295_9CAUD|nr:HNH endonuclease [Gordonia phage Pons]UDL15233.1 HNH endonuclease [Gordonia phage Pons]
MWQDRNDSLPRATRRRIRARGFCEYTDNGSKPCMRPVPPGTGGVDHIIPRAEGGSNDDDNLQLLCEDHHSAKSKAESARGRERYRKRGRYDPGAHPAYLQTGRR